MIKQYTLTLLPPEGQVLFSGWAYRLYSWLLDQLSEENGELFHTQAEHPIAQYLFSEKGTAFWKVSLLTDEACELFSAFLDSVEQMDLHRGQVTVTDRKVKSVSYRELATSAKNDGSGKANFQLLTPTAFKQAGRYVSFPQERLILQSLLKRWNAFCPEYSIDDEDAIRLLEQGLRFGDYSLRSQRYPLKDTTIPGFMGELAVLARLPAPMQELWCTLLSFAPYSGIGIKTALGMGGVRITTSL